jgi:hypothetical protein
MTAQRSEKEYDMTPNTKTPKDWTCLATRTQLVRLYSAWGVTAKVPAKVSTHITFPTGPQYSYAFGVITKYNRKSTEGKTLFHITLTNTPTK